MAKKQEQSEWLNKMWYTYPHGIPCGQEKDWICAPPVDLKGFPQHGEVKNKWNDGYELLWQTIKHWPIVKSKNSNIGAGIWKCNLNKTLPSVYSGFQLSWAATFFPSRGAGRHGAHHSAVTASRPEAHSEALFNQLPQGTTNSSSVTFPESRHFFFSVLKHLQFWFF